jgi:hypothetical protein
MKTLALVLAALASTSALATEPSPTISNARIFNQCDEDTSVDYRNGAIQIDYGVDFQARASAGAFDNAKCKVEFDVTPPPGYYVEFDTIEVEYQAVLPHGAEGIVTQRYKFDGDSDPGSTQVTPGAFTGGKVVKHRFADNHRRAACGQTVHLQTTTIFDVTAGPSGNARLTADEGNDNGVKIVAGCHRCD